MTLIVGSGKYPIRELSLSSAGAAEHSALATEDVFQQYLFYEGQVVLAKSNRIEHCSTMRPDPSFLTPGQLPQDA